MRKIRELPPYFHIKVKGSKGIEYQQKEINEKAYVYQIINIDKNEVSYIAFARMVDYSLCAVIFPSSNDIGYWAFKGNREYAYGKFAELSNPGMI